MKLCKLCGCEIIGRWKNAQYCSASCQKDAHIEQTLAAYHHKRSKRVVATRVCQWQRCAKSFLPSHGKQIYCCAHCRTCEQLHRRAVRGLSKYHVINAALKRHGL